jgi:hypothetical protein
VTVTEELYRKAAEANADRHTPDWRVEETICAARSNIANTRGAFADAARSAEQAAGIARAGGDLADASLQLGIAAVVQILVGDAPRAVPLACEALALARQIGAPALIAPTGLLAVGATVAQTDPDRARACLRESLELSKALAYQSPLDLFWATGIAVSVNDRTATLELGRRAIHRLQSAGNGLGMVFVLHTIAGALAATRPEAAVIIQGGRSLCGPVADYRSAHQLDRHGTSGRGARARTPRPPTWTGTKPSPTPLPRSHKPSTNPNPTASHERVRPSRCTPRAHPVCLPPSEVIVHKMISSIGYSSRRSLRLPP